MREIFFLLVVAALSFSAGAQNLGDYLNPLYPIEQKLQSLGGGQIGGLSFQTYQNAFQRGGIRLDNATTGKMKKAISVLEQGLPNFGPGKMYNTAAQIQSFFSSNGFPISGQAAQNILNHLTAGAPKVGANAHVFLMAYVANKGVAEFIKYIESLVETAQRPSRPDSPASRSIKRVMSRGLTLQQITLPKADRSGDWDWFGNAYASVNYSFTSYDDIASNGSGKDEAYSLVLGGDIGGDTSLSVSFAKQRNHRGGENQLTSKSYGGDLLIHHKLNEHFGLGVYGFYQEVSIEGVDESIYNHGYGFLGSLYYDFDIVDVTMIHTYNKAWYKFGFDNLYVGSVRVNRNWNDWFSSALTASYTDSLRSNQSGDNSYWILGGDVTFRLTDHASLNLGYERTAALDDYRSHTFNVNFIWQF